MFSMVTWEAVLNRWFEGYPDGLLGVLGTAVAWAMYVWLLGILQFPLVRRMAIRSAVALPLGFAVQILAGWDWAEDGGKAFMIAALAIVVLPVEKLVPRRKRPSSTL